MRKLLAFIDRLLGSTVYDRQDRAVKSFTRIINELDDCREELAQYHADLESHRLELNMEIEKAANARIRNARIASKMADIIE